MDQGSPGWPIEPQPRDLLPAPAKDELTPDSLGRQFSRRSILRSVALLGTVAAVGPLASRLEELVRPAPAAAGAAMEMAPAATRHWVMVIDLRRCDGCGKCTEVCQATHYLAPEQTWLKVYKLHDAVGTEYYMPRPCMQCEDAPCLRVCPVGATFQASDGPILVDPERCIGCRLCMAACPYEGRYFNWTEPARVPPLPSSPTPEFPAPARRGTVGKCTFCVHMTRHGELPSCVDGCPMNAIWIGDRDADIATNGPDTVRLSTFLAENNAVRFKEELNTRPSVYYILGHGQNLEF